MFSVIAAYHERGVGRTFAVREEKLDKERLERENLGDILDS